MELEPVYVDLIKQDNSTAFYPSGAVMGTVSAGENFVADFNDEITFDAQSFRGDTSLKERGYNGVNTVVSARNIVLHANNIRGDSGFQAKQDFSAIAENNLNLQHADLRAGQALSLLAVNNLSATQTVLDGKDISLIARQGDIRFSEPDIRYYDSDGQPHVSQLNAGEKVTLDVSLMISDYLLMRYSGFYGQAHPGEIYRPIMATGKIHIAVFVGGVTKG